VVVIVDPYRVHNGVTVHDPLCGVNHGPFGEIDLLPVITESYGRPVGTYMMMVLRARLRAVWAGLGMASAR
jgi:hypothetical protein